MLAIVNSPFYWPFFLTKLMDACSREHSSLLLLGQQAPQAKIVNHILNLLNLVLDAIAALTQRVVLQVQNLEPSVHLLNKLSNLHRPAVVAQRNRIPRQTRQLVEQRNQTLQVLLDGEVESVAVLEVRRHGQDAAHVVEGEKLAARGVHAAQVAAEQDAEDDSLHFAGPGVAVLVVGVLGGGGGEGLDGGDFFVDAFTGSGQDVGH